MMKTVTLAAVALVGIGLAAPASAMPLHQGSTKYVPQPRVMEVGKWKGGHHRYWRHRHHDNDNFGFGFGFPLALGLGIGAPLYADQYYGYGGYDGYGGGHVEYCLDRYRSYDPETNTFMGYDGYQHECISPYM
jgi:hypothetical protein